MGTAYAVPVASGASTGAAARPSLLLVWAITAAGIATAAISLSLGLTNDTVSGLQILLLEWISIPYVVAGLIAWWRRPDSRLGVLMTAGGFATAVSALAFARFDGPHTLGIVFDVLPAVIFLHVYLAFPEGRLRSRFERVVVAAAYVAAVGLQVAKMTLGGVGPGNLLEVTAAPELARAVERAQLLSISAICMIGIVILVTRRRAAGRPLRRPLAILVDSFAIGLLMISLLFVLGAVDGPWFLTVQRATLVVIGISPIVFLSALLDARLARSAVADLFVQLQADPSQTGLRDALARALRDPSLTLAFWLPEFESWADLEGRRTELPEGRADHAATLIERDGVQIAALVHAPALLDEPELLAAVGAAAGMALENGRLQAEQQAHLEELKGSRARVIEAEHRERQRLERNLHDGAQQRLIALSLELKLLEKQLADDPAAAVRLDRARHEIAVSLDELRAVARGLHPAVLSGHGLEVALESIVAHSTTPVRLDVSLHERLPPQIEAAAFYVVSESLANIAKHAEASSITVEVRRQGNRVTVDVRDDGVGGADTERGSGLRGLADRVEAQDGRLRIWSPPGGGTRLLAEMPCG